MPKATKKLFLKRQKLRNKTVPPVKEIKVVFFPMLMIKSPAFFIFKSALYFKVNCQKKYVIIS